MRTPTTIQRSHASGRRAVPALLAAALVLGGCSATHVGDAWQCPVAQGQACTSVADADPAVGTPVKARQAGLPERPELREAPGVDDGGGSDAACAGGCDPFAWLANWLGAPEEPRDGAAVGESAPVSPGEEAPDPDRGGLRTKERIARIWIAPFVDAAGVYREGHWVRTVLEPARWRLR